MSTDRLEALLGFLQETPDDPFTLYAVATEYRREHPEKALGYYEKLLAEHPTYVPTYYHAAQLYVDLNQPERAEQTYQKGIAEAQKQSDALALRELRSAYDEFLYE
ncbi:MAG: tetratricopeptide repeat protein [Tunicatimonas sp.]